MEQRLRDLVRDGRAWVHVGTVDSVEEHAAFGFLVNCTIRPDGRECQARLLSPGGGAGRGSFSPVEEGDEVLLLLPEGDPNKAVAIGGLSSRANPIPSGADNGHLEIVQPGGVKVRTTEAAVVQKVVLVTILPDLQAALTEVQVALAALGLPTTQLAAFITQLSTPPTYRSGGFETE
jgi:phage baseplate assembly protein gpV